MQIPLLTAQGEAEALRYELRLFKENAEWQIEYLKEHHREEIAWWKARVDRLEARLRND